MAPSSVQPTPGTSEAAPRPGTPQPAAPLLSARRVRKGFQVGERRLEVLHGIDVELDHGEVVAMVGTSGAGKSTLLHVLGLLERPDEGSVLVDGEDGWTLPTVQRAELRNRKIGFVFQFYHLLPELNAVENVLLPAMIAASFLGYRRRRRALRERAQHLLDQFGLSDRLRHRPSQLSGGERQRVALARALFHDPPLLIADEPTGNLDSGTGQRVLDLLFEEQQRRGLTLLLVTHDDHLAERCERTIYMEDGMIVGDSGHPVPD